MQTFNKGKCSEFVDSHWTAKCRLTENLEHIEDATPPCNLDDSHCVINNIDTFCHYEEAISLDKSLIISWILSF